MKSPPDSLQAPGDPDRRRLPATASAATADVAIAPLAGGAGLKAGVRGPKPLEDNLFREKMTAFEHERIPERVVHARGAAAHMLSTHLGELRGAVGGTLPVDHLLATMPPVVFDAVAVAGGAVSIAALKASADAVHFVREASKHAAPAEGADRLRQAGIVSGPDDASSSGLSIGADPAARANAFLNVIPMPRHWERSSTDAMAA